MNISVRSMLAVLSIFVAALLSGCGGGGGSSSFAPALSGVAATGQALSNAIVTLKDAAGNAKTVTTGADGSYQFALTGLTAPFLLEVSAGAGTTLYSFAGPNDTIANLNPYTSVILQAYYMAQGSDVVTAFSGTLSSSSFPNATQLALLMAPIVSNLQPYLINATVANPTVFNPFSTPFTANHGGFDRILDRTVLNSNLLTYTVDNGTTTMAGPVSSSVTLTVTVGSGSTLSSVAVTTNTTNASIASSSQTTVPVGASLAQQSDLAAAQSGVLSLFGTLQQLAASKPSLVAGDVLSYIDAGYLNQGQTQSTYAAQLASGLASALPAGATITIYRVNQFTDGTPQYLTATIEIQSPTGEVSFLGGRDSINAGIVFKKETNGNWEFYGSQTTANAHVQLQEESCYGCSGPNTTTTTTPTQTLTMMAQVSVAVGTLSGASVSGPANSLPANYCSSTNYSAPLTQSSVALVKDNGTYNGEDRFDLPCWATSTTSLSGTTPPAGTVYTFTLTPVSGPVVTSTDTLNSATIDNGDLLTINGTPRATYAANNPVSAIVAKATSTAGAMGTAMTLTYTLPTTYPVLYSYLAGFCQNATEVSNGGGSDFTGDVGTIPPSVTTGTITIPATCGNAPTVAVNLNVWFIGVNGEVSMVNQIFNP